MRSDYYKSERFIHDELCRRSEQGVASIQQIWKEQGKIGPFFLAWPAEIVKAHDGTPIEDICRLELPEVKEEWSKLFQQAVELTKAYAILLCEQKEDGVKVILESPHGTRCWTLPIERHGDVYVLGKVNIKDDVESVGLLWRPNRGRA